MATGYSDTPIVPATPITIHSPDERPAIVVPPSWLIDARGGEIDFQLLVPGEIEFQVVPEQAGWMASPTFGKSFKLERTLEEDGFLKYTLHMK